jgi:hypothetical protein
LHNSKNLRQTKDAENKKLFCYGISLHNAEMIPPHDSLRIAWYRNSDGHPLLHFDPALWGVICRTARRYGDTSPRDPIVTYIDRLIQMNAKTDPTDRTLFALEWHIYDGIDKEPQADLMFPGNVLPTIAQLWGTTEEDVRDIIANSLLSTVIEQYETTGVPEI